LCHSHQKYLGSFHVHHWTLERHENAILRKCY
jgi:hypothetical protein